jgi:predicted nucleic acid-binding protein
MAFLDMEIGEGFEAVDTLFTRADTEDITISMNIVNLVEVYYGFIQKYGTSEVADEIMRNVNDLPIEVVSTISNTVYRETARYKAGYSVSLADAFLCASAKSFSATIVTKDSEIKQVEQAENLSVLWI